jgi:hypothetical protein
VAESPLDFPAVMTRQKHEGKGFFLGRTQKKRVAHVRIHVMRQGDFWMKSSSQIMS